VRKAARRGLKINLPNASSFAGIAPQLHQAAKQKQTTFRKFS
jgi:hypothetical protein